MSTAKLTRSAPYFPVADVARSAAHYQRVFGFQTEYSAGSPAEFAIVTRDGFSIMLRRVEDAGPISPNERQGGTWDVFSDERLKNIKGRYNSGLKALMQLQPLRYEYKSDNALGIKLPGEQIGFGAQALQKVIPEAVRQDSSGYLMVKSDPIIWTMLNAIKEQQQEIAELKAQVHRLSGHSRRHRK